MIRKLPIAVVAAALLLCSTAGAATWSPFGTNMSSYHQNVISCPVVGVCFAIAGAGLIGGPMRVDRSLDSGRTWTTVLTLPNADALSAISCPTPLECFVGGTNGTSYGNSIWSTTTGGSSWQQTTLSPASSSNDQLEAVYCVDALKCWAGSNGGAGYVTTNGGSSWSSQHPGPDGGFRSMSCVTELLCWRTNGYGVDKTTDGGATWTTQTTNIVGPWASIACASATTCYVADYGAHITSTIDGGITWSTTAPVINGNLYGIACPSATECWAAGGQSGSPTDILNVVSTNDGGLTWTVDNLHYGADWALWSISCPASQACWANGISDNVWTNTAPLVP